MDPPATAQEKVKEDDEVDEDDVVSEEPIPHVAMGEWCSTWRESK
jgi:hypothetical protein